MTRRRSTGSHRPPGRPARSPGTTSPEWAELVEAIEACTRCPLHATRKNVVVYRGGARPRVLFLGEAPGADEDRAGVPFVGRSGARLDRAIEFLGLAASEVGVINLLKCRPPGNRFDPAAARTCRPFLDRQIELLGPEILVPLGARALAALDPEAPRITEASGRPRRALDHPIFPLLHPAAALHAPGRRARWEADLIGLRRYLAGSRG